MQTFVTFLLWVVVVVVAALPLARDCVVTFLRELLRELGDVVDDFLS